MAEPERQSVGTGAGDSGQGEADRSPRGTAAAHKARRWLVLLCAGVAGGLLGWSLVDNLHATFVPAHVPPPPGASAMNPAFDPQLRVAFREAELKNAVLSLAVLGAALGGWLGVAMPFAAHRPSLLKAILGLLCGALLGAACGALGSYAGYTAGNALVDRGGLKPLHGAYMAQGIAWAILGIGVGLGVSLPTARPGTIAANAGLAALAGVLSVAVYQVVAALALPAENTERLVPASTAARLTWALVSCVVVGLVLAARGTAAGSQASTAQP